MNYYTVVFSVWSVFFPTSDKLPAEANDIASAIVTAVDKETTPVFKSKEEDVAAMALFAFLESGLQTHPVPHSWDARAGISCGVWQESCRFVASHTIEEQATWWIIRTVPLIMGATSTINMVGNLAL